MILLQEKANPLKNLSSKQIQALEIQENEDIIIKRQTREEQLTF